jgi:ferredoxin
VKLYVGELRDLEEAITKLREILGDVEFLGYVLRGGIVILGEVKSLSDMPLWASDHQAPGRYELTQGFRFRHSFYSPKWFLLPPEHGLLVTTPNYNYTSSLSPPEKRIVLLGIKPCDLTAVSVLDKILLGKHPVYTLRRRSIVGIIVEECLEPGETCFCSVTGSGPLANSGFDLGYARLDENTFLFKPGSQLGHDLIKRLNLGEAGREHIESYYNMVKRALDTMKTRIPELQELVVALSKSVFNEGFWREISEKCVGCGNCNYVCPTCFCTEIVDIVEESRSLRTGIWSGCLTYTYGLVAGGHFRRDLYTRYRHYVLHKFLFYPKQTGGLLGCVGCGRCITWCPIGVDLRETLNSVVRKAS